MKAAAQNRWVSGDCGEGSPKGATCISVAKRMLIPTADIYGGEKSYSDDRTHIDQGKKIQHIIPLIMYS
jgi:hypothetical protein